jgi:N-acetyl-D-muramate 6-phosphate phosphatase
MSNASIGVVLLDLDGTLLDTAPDMGAALNKLRWERGAEPLPFASIRPYVSHGAATLVRVGFPRAEDAELVELRARFLEIYRQDVAVATTLFPGFEAVLPELEARSIRWGIVTNKPGFLTEPLLARLRLQDKAACVVSGDTVARRKPDPAPLLHAAKLLHVEPAHCVYVGDAERDIQAGRAAGMQTIVALFGYLGDQDRPDSWQADASIDSPAELLTWLDSTRGADGPALAASGRGKE